METITVHEMLEISITVRWKVTHAFLWKCVEAKSNVH